ncbi:MAG TPA: sulfite exporter TauE/SafE family protein, partial [Lacipirellulaceae bacterium]|nr:sulfite exporter TauE/SafE family protein [Lacipirellulaceae bacterium]
AGVATGFIPCGLVYALLLKAAASGTVLNGAATMALFGLGTAPLMIAAGVGGTWVAASTRARLMRAAAWCVVVVGAMTLARGAVQLNAPGDGPAPCPFCASAEDGERQGVSAPSREASP